MIAAAPQPVTPLQQAADAMEVARKQAAADLVASQIAAARLAELL